MNALERKIITVHENTRINTCIKNPKFVCCEIRWCDTGEREIVNIGLFPYSKERIPDNLDNCIFFYTNGLASFISLAANIDFVKEDFDNEEDFYAEIEKYHTDDPNSDDWTYLHRGEDFAVIDIINYPYSLNG